MVSVAELLPEDVVARLLAGLGVEGRAAAEPQSSSILSGPGVRELLADREFRRAVRRGAPEGRIFALARRVLRQKWALMLGRRDLVAAVREAVREMRRQRRREDVDLDKAV
jgi:hypothetical protein